MPHHVLTEDNDWNEGLERDGAEFPREQSSHLDLMAAGRRVVRRQQGCRAPCTPGADEHRSPRKP